MLSKKFAKLFISKEFSQIGLRCLSLTASNLKEKNVAVVLSGCGVYDGSEITEAVSVMVHLSRHNAKISFFAPNIEQLHVVNHVAGSVEAESRNVMCESARIARGNIQALDKLKGSRFDALIVPGGFGAAKNLCSYALNGEKMTVNPEMERVINEFVVGTKPIGLCCIAPVIAARLLPGCVLTVGKKDTQDWPYGGTIDSLKNMGASVVEKDINEIAIDEKYKVVTTPAFMKNASFYEVFNGIGSMVDHIMKLCN